MSPGEQLLVEYDHSFTLDVDGPLEAAQVLQNLIAFHDIDKNINNERARKACEEDVQRIINRKEAGKLRYDL